MGGFGTSVSINGKKILQGLKLELRTKDRAGLLLDITRTIRENGMCIRRAEMSIEDGMAVDNFHVTDMLGNPVETKEVKSLCSQICKTSLQVEILEEQNIIAICRMQMDM
ncbi:hypothetical protein QJS10_CPA01g02244 [Acorus calamus]|uniref:ACT domain-containing protein ACR n=1 Tax=Acorus calamus TaxID=4465 RepID=A0AAV9FM35_ACOCL|nr:hypothetical protein QJS10_CPA01g02244 [Acorus calamus]